MIVDSTFVISSGRCGSTMLSNMIALENETLSVQESLAYKPLRTSVTDLDRLAETVLSGVEYWALLNRPDVLTRLGIVTGEARYPAGGQWADRPTELPLTLTVMLPAISADPDALFDTLATMVSQFPPAPAAAHHRRLLDLLATKLRRRRWVERTGGSSLLVTHVVRCFPAASIIYLTRRIDDAALSMSRHPAFQLAQLRMTFQAQCGIDPFTSLELGTNDGGLDERQVPRALRAVLPGRLTATSLQNWADQRTDFPFICAFMMAQVEQVLIDHPPVRLLRLKYEDLIERPVAELIRLAEFLGFANPQEWSCRAAAQLDRAA